jgi:hypothetical protein
VAEEAMVSKEIKVRVNEMTKPDYFFIIGGVGLSPLGTAATSGLLYKPQMIDDDDGGAIDGM